MNRDDVRDLMPSEDQNNRCEIYETFKNDCWKRIQSHAEKGDEHCVFVVPPFSFGLPVYDPEEIFVKLYEDLGKSGFQLLGSPKSRRLIICWFEDTQTATTNLENEYRKIMTGEPEK